MGSGRLAATIFFFQPSLHQSQNWILLQHRRDFGGKDLALGWLRINLGGKKSLGEFLVFTGRHSHYLEPATGNGEKKEGTLVAFSYHPQFTPVLLFSSSPIFLRSHQFSHFPVLPFSSLHTSSPTYLFDPPFPYSASLLHQYCRVPNPKMVFNINLFPHCPLKLISCPPTSSFHL